MDDVDNSHKGFSIDAKALLPPKVEIQFCGRGKAQKRRFETSREASRSNIITYVG